MKTRQAQLKSCHIDNQTNKQLNATLSFCSVFANWLLADCHWSDTFGKIPWDFGNKRDSQLPVFSQSRLSPWGVKSLLTPTTCTTTTTITTEGDGWKAKGIMFIIAPAIRRVGATDHRKSGVCAAAHSMRRGIEVWGEIKTGGWESVFSFLFTFFLPAHCQKVPHCTIAIFRKSWEKEL